MRSPFDTDERRAFRETLAQFFAAKIKPHSDAGDEAGVQRWVLHQKVGRSGVTQACLEDTIKWAQNRETFGAP